jgi:peptide/nickel transport system permease protein
MITYLSNIMIPGLFLFRNKGNSILLIWFTIPFIIIFTHSDKFYSGLKSFFFTGLLFISDYNSSLNFISLEIGQYWIASSFIIIWIVSLWFYSFFCFLKKNAITTNNIDKPFFINRINIFFIMILISLFVISLIVPLLAPFNPNLQQDIVVTKHLKPFSSVRYLQLNNGHREQNFNLGMSSGIIQKELIKINSGLQDFENNLIYIDSMIISDTLIYYWQGKYKQTIKYRQTSEAGKNLLTGNEFHVLGTDKFGRDVLSRILYGARISIFIGASVVIIAVFIGLTIGCTGGYLGGWVDIIFMRLIDLMLSFPMIFLILLIIALSGSSFLHLIMILSLTGWMGIARITRAQILKLKQLPFIENTIGLGYSPLKIITRHLLPNAIEPVIVAAALKIGTIILIEAGLSFLGLGVQPPTASLGNMIYEGRDGLIQHWWISVFPGFMLISIVLSVNVLGDHLRDFLDPKLY